MSPEIAKSFLYFAGIALCFWAGRLFAKGERVLAGACMAGGLAACWVGA